MDISHLIEEEIVNWEAFKLYDLPLPVGVITDKANKAIKDFLRFCLTRIAYEAEQAERKVWYDTRPKEIAEAKEQGRREVITEIDKWILISADENWLHDWKIIKHSLLN